jgi:Ca-activated chloride channel family protein
LSIPRFADPLFLLVLVTIVPWVWLLLRRSRSGFPAIPFSSLTVFSKFKQSRIKPMLRFVPVVTKLTALILLIIALARPQSISKGQDVSSEGIDIIIALDISASMRARDLTPDRAEAAKRVAANFIDQRPQDRIGIVLFAKQAFTQCPLTVDHSILKELLENVQIGLVDPDNTAIGQALGVALNRMKDSDSRSKVIILLTDGENNFGQPPTTLAEAAEAIGVRVYTIGVGTIGQAPYPFQDPFGRTRIQNVAVSIDEELLKEVAYATGGKYFRATDDETLTEIFSEIDQMEKTKIEVRAFRRFAELYYNWVIAALILLTIGWLSAAVIFRSIA